jgi:hypothetical protein
MLRQVRLPPKARKNISNFGSKQEDSGTMIQMIHLEEKVCDIDNDNMGITYTTKTITTCIDRLPPL